MPKDWFDFDGLHVRDLAVAEKACEQLHSNPKAIVAQAAIRDLLDSIAAELNSKEE